MSDIASSYRASMFDGEAGVDWLRPGWRALRLYGQKAKSAMQENDMLLKADMLSRADQLLNIMTGILDTSEGTTLGPALTRIYSALRLALLDANMGNSTDPLDDFDRALRTLDFEFTKLTESTSERR
jgi:flagellin-specific chaperone FliS